MGSDHVHDHPDHAHDDESPVGERDPARALRVGIGGPVGSGKTELVACLCRAFEQRGISVAVVTNDIFTKEDAAILERRAVLPVERIVGVRTGCCPHTAIRDDISENVDAIEGLEVRFAPDGVLVESGGDKVPRKGGPGITGADLLVINKTDLADMVGSDLDVMRTDARRMRGDRPTMLVSLRQDQLATTIAAWIRDELRVWQAA